MPSSPIAQAWRNIVWAGVRVAQSVSGAIRSPVDAAPHAVVPDMGTVAPSVVTDVWTMAPSASPVGASPAAIGTMAVAVAHDAGDVDRRRGRGVMDHAAGGDDDGLTAAIVAIAIAGVAVVTAGERGCGRKGERCERGQKLHGNLHPSLFAS
jgi:hypothetical protein